MNPSVTRHLGALLGWIVLASACASGELFFREIGTRQGLPDANVTGLAQAPDGYLWVATEGGLVKWNGNSSTEISLGRFPDVKNRVVRTMMFDRQGRVWVGMDGGPTIRLGRHGGRTFREVDGAFDNTALAMAEDGRSVVWIAYDEGLCRMEGEGVRRYTGEDGLPEGGNFQLTADGKGDVWFLKGGKLGLVGDGGCEVLGDFGKPGSRIAGSRSGGGLAFRGWGGDAF